MRLINILNIIFLGLTIFLLVIHIKRIEYFENPSHNISEELYSGDAKISTYLRNYENDDYQINISVHYIKADLIIQNINVELTKINSNRQTELKLLKILPYSGMNNWDISEFKDFSKIPNELKELNQSSNPYFSYDFIFKNNSKEKGEKFNTKITVKIIENGIIKTFIKKIEIVKKSKFSIIPLDMHSDITFLFIPLTALISFIILIIKTIKIIKGKYFSKN